MQIVITLDGAETKAQVNRIIVGIAALYGQVPDATLDTTVESHILAADVHAEIAAENEQIRKEVKAMAAALAAERTPFSQRVDAEVKAATVAAVSDYKDKLAQMAATLNTDAAAVFGACPLHVDVAVSATAPVAPQAGVPPPPIASLPPAPPPAPTASASTVAAPTGSVVTDKNGLPWDARIHASTKVFNADGTWRGRRNTDAAIVASVEAELRALMAIPNAAPPPPPAPGPAAAVSPTTLAEMMPLLTTAMLAGKLQATAVGQVLAEMGVAGGAPMLAARPDLVPQVWAALSTRFGL